MKRIPVTILTGFLGAGKTTLLNRLISQPAFGDTAVIVNEFGEAGVDGALVAGADERAFAMSVGCLCCTISGDVRLTLLRILDEAERGVGPKFDRVVIETTGLADPLPLLQTFMTNDFVLERFTLNGVVTLVDTVNGAKAIALSSRLGIGPNTGRSSNAFTFDSRSSCWFFGKEGLSRFQKYLAMILRHRHRFSKTHCRC